MMMMKKKMQGIDINYPSFLRINRGHGSTVTLVVQEILKAQLHLQNVSPANHLVFSPSRCWDRLEENLNRSCKYLCKILRIFAIIETGKHERERVAMQITRLSLSLSLSLFAPDPPFVRSVVSEMRGSRFFLNKRQE